MARPGGSSDDAQKEIRITSFLNFLETNALLYSLIIMKALQNILLGWKKGRLDPMKPVLYGKSNYEIISTLPSFFICCLR